MMITRGTHDQKKNGFDRFALDARLPGRELSGIIRKSGSAYSGLHLRQGDLRLAEDSTAMNNWWWIAVAAFFVAGGIYLGYELWRAPLLDEDHNVIPEDDPRHPKFKRKND